MCCTAAGVGSQPERGAGYLLSLPWVLSAIDPTSHISDYRPACLLCRTASGSSTRVTGLLKNFNTIEEFKDSDKQALFQSVLDKVGEERFRSGPRHC